MPSEITSWSIFAMRCSVLNRQFGTYATFCWQLDFMLVQILVSISCLIITNPMQ